jgi:hypothetical protein
MTTTNSLSPANHTPEDILHPDSRKLFRYWEGLRREKTAPAKSDLDIKQIAGILPFLGILERHPLRQVYHWRLAGTGICKVFAHNLTQTRFLAGWPEFETSVLSRMLDTVVSNHQPSIARIKAGSEHGEIIGLELLVLPVTTDRPNVTHLLVALVPFREPLWIGEIPLATFELSKVKTIWTEHASSHASTHIGAALTPTSGQTSNRPLFRVIDGGLTE